MRLFLLLICILGIFGCVGACPNVEPDDSMEIVNVDEDNVTTTTVTPSLSSEETPKEDAKKHRKHPKYTHMHRTAGVLGPTAETLSAEGEENGKRTLLATLLSTWRRSNRILQQTISLFRQEQRRRPSIREDTPRYSRREERVQYRTRRQEQARPLLEIQNPEVPGEQDAQEDDAQELVVQEPVVQELLVQEPVVQDPPRDGAAPPGPAAVPQARAGRPQVRAQPPAAQPQRRRSARIAEIAERNRNDVVQVDADDVIL
ncbi:hypothetical protein CAEBREN_02418 [Caenorhabditis brenneri]|uniref:Uncharacterized protein n=1 Tax=Caenorhabditis brenneri TaxID=135651 RepID=G0N136_CAEBE|nr:hypothetical protein CAEBREN_02418 [Caenorhabditis brenneri]